MSLSFMSLVKSPRSTRLSARISLSWSFEPLRKGKRERTEAVQHKAKLTFSRQPRTQTQNSPLNSHRKLPDLGLMQSHLVHIAELYHALEDIRRANGFLSQLPGNVSNLHRRQRRARRGGEVDLAAEAESDGCAIGRVEKGGKRGGGREGDEEDGAERGEGEGGEDCRASAHRRGQNERDPSGGRGQGASGQGEEEKRSSQSVIRL